ncbi:hypothetical protein L7F22_068957 [Adiantum nelumboides]|nr:hypothetical protein [Adiantum nelumboides]
MTSERACTYTALILHADGIAIMADKILTLLKAANVSVESYWSSLFAKLLEKRSVEDLITSADSRGGGDDAVAAGGTAAPAGGAPPAVEVKKEETKEENDDDMGFTLFD